MRVLRALWIVGTFALGCPLYAGDIATIRGRSDDWYRSDEGQRVLMNIISWQHPSGGWWKAYDIETATSQPPAADSECGFDNMATWLEMRSLAHGFTLTGKPEFRASFEKGMEYIFKSQYPSGGWPQRFPNSPDAYGRHITFNDDAMTEIMRLLLDVLQNKPDFAFINATTRAKVSDAFDRGLECILHTQIKVNGAPTVWCAQHDEITLAPAKARSYELPSFSGGESGEILLLLMQIENPSDKVKQSIHAGIKWLDAHKLVGIRLERRPNADGQMDQIVVTDPAATEPLWARFYDLETAKPFYCDRDGVKKSSLDQIGHERRNGYAWIRPFAQNAMNGYPKWLARTGEKSALAN
jgi:PelA/Pel-15E family pectate lyase